MDRRALAARSGTTEAGRPSRGAAERRRPGGARARRPDGGGRRAAARPRAESTPSGCASRSTRAKRGTSIRRRPRESWRSAIRPTPTGAVAQPIPAPPSANAAHRRRGPVLRDVQHRTGPALPARRARAVRLTRRDASHRARRPDCGAAARRVWRHVGLRGAWLRQVYARVRVVVTDISGGSRCPVSRDRRSDARVVTDGAAELFGVEFGVGK